MFFKHITTKQIVEAKPNTPKWEGLNNSPSWVEAYEEDTKQGLLSEVPKETLVQLAKQQGATMHHTKDEIVDMLELKSKTLKPYFDDNLV